MTKTKTIYRVENIAGGGTFYHTLAKAIEATRDHFAMPYIESRRGRRPVIWEDDEPEATLGRYGETYDVMADRIIATANHHP